MTAKQIVHGLRCSATYRGDPVCDGCPYLVTETVPDSLRKLTKRTHGTAAMWIGSRWTRRI